MLFQCKDKTRSMDWYSSQNHGWIYASVNDSMPISVLLANTIILDYKWILKITLIERSESDFIILFIGASLDNIWLNYLKQLIDTWNGA